MIPSNGRVSPSRKSTNSAREPGILRCPIAKPAIVAITTDTGTTPTTMKVLDTSRAGMLATLNAVTKLPHWGLDGQSMPSGVRCPTDAGRS